MKLKQNAKIITTDNYMIQLDDIKKEIIKEDIYIVKAMQAGTSREEDLLKLIMNTEDIDEIIAGFKLSQFVLDYGKFLAEPDEDIVIEV